MTSALLALGAGARAAELDSEVVPARDETCLLEALASAPDDATVGELREQCARQQARPDGSLLLSRVRREQALERIPSLLTPHRRNYFLPATYATDPNVAPFADEFGELLPAESLDNVEAKFQLSLKFSLAEGFLLPRDRLYFAFTSLSFWQAYNRNISAPFRETNYEPELFWSAPLDWAPFGLDAGIVTLGMSHQSNGRGGTLSRSWNRVYADIEFEKDNLVVGLKPWWRVPESEKDDPLDASGDDNPDIDDYLGYFEFTTVYRYREHEFGLMLRNNLRDDNRGAVQLDWTFPLWRGIRGYAQYFNGYGESLIDYDARIERFGVGVLLTDLL
jgi:phospholipase A1